MVNENRRYHVALVDPMPAGFEALNPALATTPPIPPEAAPKPEAQNGRYWWWYRTWYEHQNMRDERVEAFTQLLWEGVHDYTYVARATTPGSFVVPPAKAEEMYMPETEVQLSSHLPVKKAPRSTATRSSRCERRRCSSAISAIRRCHCIVTDAIADAATRNAWSARGHRPCRHRDPAAFTRAPEHRCRAARQPGQADHGPAADSAATATPIDAEKLDEKPIELATADSAAAQAAAADPPPPPPSAGKKPPPPTPPPNQVMVEVKDGGYRRRQGPDDATSCPTRT